MNIPVSEVSNLHWNIGKSPVGALSGASKPLCNQIRLETIITCTREYITSLNEEFTDIKIMCFIFHDVD